MRAVADIPTPTDGADTMLHDLRLLLWLRVRHARTAFARLMHVTGTDPLVDRGIGERAYQLYALAAVVVCLVLLWALLLDSAAQVFALIGPEASASVLLLALLLPIVAFAVAGMKALRASPLKLTHADIAFVADSPLRTGALVADGFAAAAVGSGVVAALVGYLLGVCLGSGLGAFAAPVICALVAVVLMVSAAGGAWVLGMARLALARGPQRRSGVVVLAVGGACVAVACGVGALAATSSTFTTSAALAALGLGAALLVVAEVAALAVLAPRFDMTTAIEENALFADLQPFGVLSPLDKNTVADYRRRRKLAARLARGVRFKLPEGQGRAALASRAMLSLLRQYGGLPSILMQGAAVVPLGVCVLFGVGGPVALLYWIALLVMFPQGAREVTRVFRDDIRVRLVRDRLPYRTLELLVFDSLPTFILSSVVSCVAVAIALPSTAPLVAGLALAVLMNAALTLSCGLDAIRLYPGGPRPFYEVGALVLAGVTALLSLTGSPLLLVASAALVCAALAAVIHSGTECGC